MRPNRVTRRIVLAALVAVAVAGSSAPAPAAPQPSDPHAVPGRALVRFRPGTEDALRRVAHVRAGASVVARIAAIGFEEVSFPEATPLDAVLRSYAADPSVAHVEPVYRGRIALSPTDACLTDPCEGLRGQWHLAMTNAPFGWDAVPGTTYSAAAKPSGVTIAVLDTKVDPSHPDFVNAAGTSSDARAGGQLDLANARDWIPPSRWSGSAAYHGTFVAGLAAAAAGNGGGVAGLGYAATILPLTVVDGGGNTDSAALADAIVYAADRGARIINLSLGIHGDSRAVHDAIRYASRTALVVAAAGNNTGSTPFYPGSYRESMSVSGTDANDRRAPCSNHNANVSVSAPADRLVGLTVMPAAYVQAPCGTSAAAPQVSGLAALLFMQDARRTPADVRASIERSADDLGAPGRDDYFGHGRINAERALRAGGPATVGARPSVASGGTATVTAIASAARAIAGAEVVFGRPDATPVPMSAADGAFDETTEAVTATLRIPAGTAPGPHPVWIRSSDGTTWGATTVTVVAVDARAPVVSGVTATNAVRATGQAAGISFTVADDYADTVSYGIEFRSTATNAIVARITRLRVAVGARAESWTPSLAIPAGHYRVKIAVADASGNVTQVETGVVVA